MQSDRTIRSAFLISLIGHCLFLGVPGINMVSSQHKKPEDVAVRIEVEIPQLLPKIDVMGEEKKLKEIVKEEEPPGSKEENKEAVIEKPELPKEIVEVRNPQEEAMLRYQDMVKQRIEEARRYPSWAKRQRIEGVSCLRFTLLSNGEAQDIKIVRSSGFDILDKEAVSTVRRASPFKSIPEKFNCSTITMELAIVFRLK